MIPHTTVEAPERWFGEAVERGRRVCHALPYDQSVSLGLLSSRTVMKSEGQVVRDLSRAVFPARKRSRAR